MFSKVDIRYLRESTSRFTVQQLNGHDVTLHSDETGHDWMIVSNYEGADCYILHRHCRRYPYHRQRGQYGSLSEALDYIIGHERWYVENKS